MKDMKSLNQQKNNLSIGSGEFCATIAFYNW